MMHDELAALDATAQAELVRRGEVTAIELVDAAIARVEALNPTVNAVIHPRFEKARAEARGHLGDGPFAGVPFLIKDLMCHTAGDPLHMGTRFLRDTGFRAPHDSYLAGKFAQAGLICIGRTNTPEIGTLPTTEPEAYGPSRNPWNPAYSTGGSSGGSAAAVASRMVPMAHANDGGGSIRIPASNCGLVGLKPSRGRTSFGPDLGDGLGGLACEGVVSRSVRDTAAALDAIEGAMPGDPYTAPPPARRYTTVVATRPARLRIGVADACFVSGTAPDAENAQAVAAATSLLADLGHDLCTAHPAALDDAEASQHFSVYYAVYTARVLDALAGLVGRPIGEDDVDPLNWGLAELGRMCTAPQFLASVDWVHGFTRRVAAWWGEGHDLLLTPTLPAPPPPLGHFKPTKEDMLEVGMRAASFASFTSPFNLTGQPAISLPLHWTADGLPVGIQLVAAYGREDLLLAIAAEIEAARPWADRRPPVAA
jgi:amidase